MRIGELSRQTRVSIRTIRYYERRARCQLRSAAVRFRVYDGRRGRRVQFIRRAQDLGFTLKEIGSLLASGDIRRRPAAPGTAGTRYPSAH